MNLHCVHSCTFARMEWKYAIAKPTYFSGSFKQKIQHVIASTAERVYETDREQYLLCSCTFIVRHWVTNRLLGYILENCSVRSIDFNIEVYITHHNIILWKYTFKQSINQFAKASSPMLEVAYMHSIHTKVYNVIYTFELALTQSETNMHT